MDRVRIAYEASGQSMHQIGRAMGYADTTARQAVSQFLKSNDPRVSMVQRFARAVGRSNADLLEEWQQLQRCDPKRRYRKRKGSCVVPMPIIKLAVQATGDFTLVILALRIASQFGREDLRPEYERLANGLLNGTWGRTFESGDGI